MFIVLVSGISDTDQCPMIAGLRPDSCAMSSDQLAPCDRLLSVNGISTSHMRPDEVSSLLDSIDGNTVMELEYSLPSYGKQSRNQRMLFTLIMNYLQSSCIICNSMIILYFFFYHRIGNLLLTFLRFG